MAKKKKEEQELAFEDALRELEELTEKMEESQLPLADLIQTYDRGSYLLRFCQDALNVAGEKIELIRAKGESASNADQKKDNDEPSEQDVRLF